MRRLVPGSLLMAYSVGTGVSGIRTIPAPAAKLSNIPSVPFQNERLGKPASPKSTALEN
jgi:hypothetical protein